MLPSPSGFPINTSTPTRTVTQRPLQTDAVLDNASLLMTAFSPIRRSDLNFPCLLRSDTVNQRHATAQHIPNRQLPKQLKSEEGLETTWDVGSSGQSIETTESTPQSAAVQAIANSISAHQTKNGSKNWSQSAGRPNKHIKNVSFTSAASLEHGWSTNRIAYTFVPILINSCFFPVSTITVFWYFCSDLSPLLFLDVAF